MFIAPGCDIILYVAVKKCYLHINLPLFELLVTKSFLLSKYFIKNPFGIDVGKSTIASAFPRETRTKTKCIFFMTYLYVQNNKKLYLNLHIYQWLLE